MTYTITIQDKSTKAKSIINMLKALKDDYDFIEIKNNSKDKSDKDLEKELDKRYKAFQKNKNGKVWSDLKRELI
jgi:hypothetical protein